MSSNKAVVTTPTDTTIQIVREFDAPKDLIYKAWTTPDLIRRWWAGTMGEVTHVEVDLRVGGTWRYVMTATGGFEVAFHGEYRELVADERIVSTEVYEGAPEGFAVNTLTLVEDAGRTTMTVLVQHEKQEHRDMHINSGMETGLQTSLAALEQVAQSLA